MLQSKITDYVYESPKQKITRIIKELNDGLYKESFIEIASSEYNEDPYKDSIEDSDVILLCEALKKNPQVNCVVFYLQNVGDEGADALSNVNTLKTIHISCGILGVLGGCSLASSKVKTLVIEGCYIFYDKNENRIGEESNKFIKALIKNETIQNLRLTGTYIYEDLLIELIENTKSIKSLHLDKRGFSKEFFKDLHINQQEMHIHTNEEIILLGNDMQDNNT